MKIPSPPPQHVESPAPEALAFRFRTGEAARSLREFREALARVDAGTVAYHRAHFVPWLREVLRDDPLARRVESYAEEPRDAAVLREILLDLVDRRLAQLA